MKDHEPQLALAKMLPEKISHSEHINYGSDGSVKTHSFFWKIKTDEEHRMFERDRAILATEWLHVCWLVEQSLGRDEIWVYYLKELPSSCASWQQRAEALIKVKNNPK